MKIEAGKEYRTRDGERARVYATDGNLPYTVHGAIQSKENDGWKSWAWREDGNSYPGESYSNELVSEWKEEPVLPDGFWDRIVPPYIDHVAMDDDGRWCMYGGDPTVEGLRNFWKSPEGQYLNIPKEYAPTFSGDWKDSKITRPDRAHMNYVPKMYLKVDRL